MMKIWNNTVLLLLALSMTIGVSACANNNGAQDSLGENRLCERLEDGTMNFGAYPQTRVTDESLTPLLLEEVGGIPFESDKWESYGYYANGGNDLDYMWYCDVTYEETKYRGVYFEQYRPNQTTGIHSVNRQEENGYKMRETYWFAWEPLNWVVLEEEKGKAFLHCNSIIDAQEYYYGENSRTLNGKKIYANNYAESSVRKWLNATFYEMAFTAEEQKYIRETQVNNGEKSTNLSENSTYWNGGVNKYACENTRDRIFLLSKAEVTNPSYGLSGTALNRKTSDYAKAQGCYFDRLTGTVNYASIWWLRSPFYGQESTAQNINYYGDSNYNVRYTECGIVPALWIML